MAVTLEQATVAREKFLDEYMDNQKYPNLIAGAVITFLKVITKKLPDKISLKSGESLDDFCVSVYLVKEPAPHIKLPQEYMDVRVFYKVTGYGVFAGSSGTSVTEKPR